MSNHESREQASDGPDLELRLVGVNHLTAPARVREALAYAEQETARWVRLAVEDGAVDLGGYRVREAALLSTCNRTEAYLILARGNDRASRSRAGGTQEDESPPGAGDPDLERRLARMLCGTRSDIAHDHNEAFYQYRGSAAAHHLMRVASGLDSMVQGEAQILGQVHRAHELSREADGIGPVLDRLFTSAFRAGKRSRHETEIGRGAVSVASAAVELAVKVVGPLDRRSVLVVGAGDTGRLVAQHLSAERPAELWIANRTLERAVTLAKEVGGKACGLDELPRILGQVDVVAVATFASEPVITRAMVQGALKHRRRSTIFIDISMPRNVEPSVHGLGEAFVYDLDALQRVVKENLTRREDEIPKVNAIIEQEVAQFAQWVASLASGPLISRLRERFELLRQEEVRRHAGNLSAAEVEAVERVSRGLLNKFLHGPTVHLRNGGAGSPEVIELFRRMFELESPPPDGSQAPATDPGSLHSDLESPTVESLPSTEETP